eukprot:15436434-Alexandrium_andersonii.AAC.1
MHLARPPLAPRILEGVDADDLHPLAVHGSRQQMAAVIISGPIPWNPIHRKDPPPRAPMTGPTKGPPPRGAPSRSIARLDPETLGPRTTSRFRMHSK